MCAASPHGDQPVRHGALDRRMHDHAAHGVAHANAGREVGLARTGRATVAHCARPPAARQRPVQCSRCRRAFGKHPRVAARRDIICQSANKSRPGRRSRSSSGTVRSSPCRATARACRARPSARPCSSTPSAAMISLARTTYSRATGLAPQRATPSVIARERRGLGADQDLGARAPGLRPPAPARSASGRARSPRRPRRRAPRCRQAPRKSPS